MTHYYDVNLILHFLELFEYILKAMFQIKGMFEQPLLYYADRRFMKEKLFLFVHIVFRMLKHCPNFVIFLCILFSLF